MSAFALILTAAPGAALLAPAPMAELLDQPNRAVEAGREALDRWWGYPWYDASRDEVRPVKVEPPWNLDWFHFDLRFSPPGSWLDWLAWLSVAAVLALIAYWLIQAYRSRARARTAGSEPDTVAGAGAARVESLPYPLEDAPVDFLAEARRWYEAGDYGRAIVYLFGFELLELDRRHCIRLVRGATNRQYLRQLADRPELKQLVEATMVAFEDAFFGHHRLSRERFEQCWFRLAQFDAWCGAPT